MIKETKYNFSYLLGMALIAAMGGLLFGYDWVVIGGAKPFYELYFDIDSSPSLQGWAMSSALVGCIFGALLSGAISDKFGRKQPLLFTAILFIISAFGSGFADNFFWFIVFRLIGGVGIGMASALSPMYIAEISPAEYRGRFVAINQLTIVIGILIAQICNYLIAEPVPAGISDTEILASWNGEMGWRWMFWAELVPACMFFILLFFVPKSPRFLVKTDQEQSARKVLLQIGGEKYANSTMTAIKNSFLELDRKVHFEALKQSSIKPILLLGIVLAVFQQWCGINVIFNYAEEVFTSAGYSVGDMLFNIVITGAVNLVFTLVAMRTVDKWGRRKLMLIGSAGLCILYLFLGFSYYYSWTGWPILLIVILAISVYAMSLAPVTWVVLSEIFPNRVRGLAMSIATLSLWIASFILTYTFPLINNVLGTYGTFWIYCIICAVGFLFIKVKLPETKEKSLEEIEDEFTHTSSDVV